MSILELCIIGPVSVPATDPKSIWPLGEASELISLDDDATL